MNPANRIHFTGTSPLAEAEIFVKLMLCDDLMKLFEPDDPCLHRIAAAACAHLFSARDLLMLNDCTAKFALFLKCTGSAESPKEADVLCLLHEIAARKEAE